MKKLLMIGALAFAATTVAESAMAAEFYVVRDSTTKKCTVVDTKPTTTTTTIVSNGTYKTKTEAEAGMKTVLDDLGTKNPKVREIKPADLLDTRFLRNLKASGVIK